MPAAWRWRVSGAACAFYIQFWILTGGTLSFWSRTTDSGRAHFFTAQAQSMRKGSLIVSRAFLDAECFPKGAGCVGYHGLFPSLIRLPFVVIFGDRVFGWEIFFIASGMFVTAISAVWLTSEVESLFGIQISNRFVGFILGAGPALSTPFLFLSSRPLLYEESLIWSTAMSVLALAIAIKYWSHPRLGLLLSLTAVAVAGILSRPSGGVLGSILLLLTVGRQIIRRRDGLRKAAPFILLGILPFVTFGLVNEAKFGHPLSIPFTKHEGIASQPVRISRLERVGAPNRLVNVPTVVVQYLRPDTVHIERAFPYFTFRFPARSTEVVRSATDEDPGVKTLWPLSPDDIETEMVASVPPTSGIYFFVPVLAACLWIPLRRLRDQKTRLPKSSESRLVTIFAISATASTLPTITAYGITHRYLVDFIPLLLLVGTVAILHTWSQVEQHRAFRTIFSFGLGLFFLLSFLVNLGLTLNFQRSWAGELLSEYRDLRPVLRQKRDEFLLVALLVVIVIKHRSWPLSLTSRAK